MKLTCLAHTGAALACLLTLAACSPAETMTSTPGLSASEDEVQTGVLSAFSTPIWRATRSTSPSLQTMT